MAREDVMVLGEELQQDGFSPIGIPSESWDTHTLIVGETGAGKSTTATTAITSAHPYTDGATVVLDPKGSGWLQEIARAQFVLADDLEDVLYFDAAACLPALSVLDLRPDLAAGFPRGHVIERLSDHFIRLLGHAMPGGFQTIRSQDVIRYLIRALADPVHGDDAFALADLVTAIRQLHKSRTTPEVSTDHAADLLEDLTLGQRRTVDNIIDGALTRATKIHGNDYLRPLFDHVPADPADAFSFDDWLDRDVLLMFDISAPEPHTQRILGNLILEQLWWALRRRDQRARDAELAQVLVFVDEVANLRVDAILEKYLSMGREFGVGMVPMLQNTRQFETDGASAANTDTDARNEVLNNCQTILSGAVANDEELAAKLSGSHMSTSEVTNRLNNLPPDRWFFRPASTRHTGSVSSFVIGEPPLPPGHPDGAQPLSPADQSRFEAALAACQDTTRTTYGLTPDTHDDAGAHSSPTGTATDSADPTESLEAALQHSGYLTTLPLVESLPGTAMYEPAANALVCATCGANRSATFQGLLQTLACHSSLSGIDRAAVPPIELGLTLTADEIAAAPVDLRSLCVLQIIANMARGAYDPREIDLVHDSPHDVLGLFGIDSNDIQALKQEGLLTVDKLRGYSYYSLTTAGRDLLQLPHRKGVEWGHGIRDNTETLLHIAMVEALARYVESHYVSDPDSPVTTVERYFEVGETATESPLDAGTRFDVVGRDAEGRLRVIGEAERHNNDAATAAVADYDKIATVSPAEALWVVPSTSAGHDAVLSPLADPPDGRPRVDGYSDSTRIPSISGIDEPGLTGIFTLNELRKTLEPPSLSGAD